MDENFAKVPRWMFNRREFVSREKLVFTALCMFQDADGECAPSVQELADFCSLSRPPVFAALKGLEEKGAITRRSRFQNGSQTTSLYTITGVLNPNTLSLLSKNTPPERKIMTNEEIEAWSQKMLAEIRSGRVDINFSKKTTSPPTPSP